MQKFSIKLTRTEQESLMDILMNFNITLIEDVMDRYRIKYLGEQILKRLNNHLRDTVDNKDWTFTLHYGEAATFYTVIMCGMPSGAFWQHFYNKLMFALHAYFNKLEGPRMYETLNLNENNETRTLTE